MRHLNVSSLRAWLDERYVVGRVYGADRARGWSVGAARRLRGRVAAPAALAAPDRRSARPGSAATASSRG